MRPLACKIMEFEFVQVIVTKGFRINMNSYECSRCNRIFSYRRSFLKHWHKFHINGLNHVRKSKETHSFECSLCGRIFGYKRNFLKHWRNFHINGSNYLRKLKKTCFFECSQCGHIFGYRRNFLKHWRKFHNNGSNNLRKSKQPRLFECSQCGRVFKQRFTFLRHWRKFHINGSTYLRELKEPPSFECSQCGRIFKQRFTFLRHWRKFHINGSVYLRELREARSSECSQCGRTFKQRCHFLRHWRKFHINGSNCLQESKETHSFECSHCGRVLKQRSHFLRHWRNFHDNCSNSRLFECSYCGHIFKRKDYLTEHEHKFHTNRLNNLSDQDLRKKRSIVGFKCVQCDSLFDKCNLLENHYREIHNFTLKHETLKFSSFSDFSEWKSNIERETVTHFRIGASWNSLKHTKKVFTCHRSGFYQQKCVGDKRKRFLKDCGSKKIQGHCPAQMTLTIDRATGLCVLDFVPLHLGHAVRDKRELRHIYWNTEEKLKLAAKIQNSLTAEDSKECQHLPKKSKEKNDRAQLLNCQDAENITQKCSGQPDITNDDIVHVDTFNLKYKDAILFYKPQMVKDKENIFQKEDFALIFMNDDQEKNLRRYGHKIICFDSAYGTNNVLLHTLMVLDVNYDEVPAAFAISNRNDQLVIDVLLKCIHDRVGIISPKCLMSDMQDMYLNSWNSIMGEPEHYLYCFWHVREAWRKNLLKVKNKTKRDFIWNQLNEIANELNLITFEVKLQAFLLLHDQEEDDADMVKKFVQYFRENFVDNGTKSRWAYCFRKEACINTNMFLESFHRKLKWGAGKGKTIEKLYDALQVLLNFLKLKETEEEIKEIRGKRTQKRRKLRHRHSSADKFLQEKSIDDVVNVIDENTWLVHSWNDENTPYTVKKIDSKECAQYADVVCQLACNICQICFHEYTCDCVDAVIKNNMCKHMHLIGLFLQKHKTLEMTDCCAADTQANAGAPDIVNVYPDMNQHCWVEVCYQNVTNIKSEEEENVDESGRNALFSQYQAAKENAYNQLEKAFAQTQDPKIIQALTKRYITPMESVIHAINVKEPDSLLLEDNV